MSPSELAHSGFFVLRTPLLPLAEFLGWGGDRERLRAALARPELREAIFLAAPEMAAAAERWVAAEAEPSPRAEQTLARYLARAAGRATPYGLLAGAGWGRIGATTELALGARERYVRLSYEWLLTMAECLPAGARLRPNPARYVVGGEVRFIAGGSRTRPRPYALRAVARSPRLDAVLAGAPPGPLAERLAGTGLLASDSPVAMTGDRPDGGARDRPELAAALGECDAALAELRSAPLGAREAAYAAVERPLAGLVRPSAPRCRAVHVELRLPLPAAVLGEAVAEELARAVETLHRIGSHPGPDPELAAFRERFATRYGQREVLLLEALDPEIGVGFGPGPERRAPPADEVFAPDGEPPAHWTPRDAWLAARLWAARDAPELVLTRADVDALAALAGAGPLPGELVALGAVAAESDAALAAGRFRVLLRYYGGPGGAGLIARFCLGDPGLLAAVRAHLRAEEELDPDAIHAEIVHLPSEPHADLLARPALREYEIACLGPSGAPPERRIELDDLLVSVVGDRVELRSERLGRRVLPRLTCAHNFGYFGAKTYRFLCLLQGEGVGCARGLWGPLETLGTLPRVRYGRTVLARARWRLGAGDDVQAWRRRCGVPRLVALAEGDRELPVDLDNPVSAASLARAARRDGARVVEFFPPPGELIVHGPEGAYAHELLVPFTSAARPLRPAGPAVVPARRTFPPGSEWAYLKLDARPAAIDRILVDEVPALVAGRAWFFARYDQPTDQLRLRVRAPGARAVLEALAARLLERRLAWNAELGTYERELERYGDIEAAEMAFCADSDAVLALLAARPPDAERWRLALYGAHRLLDDLGLDLHARLGLVTAARDALAREHRLTAAQQRRMGEHFRRERAAPAAPREPAIFAARSERLRPLADQLRDAADSLVHMHLNRLLRSRWREQELVVHDLLARRYTAELRRG